jgi:hypothetical protein
MAIGRGAKLLFDGLHERPAGRLGRVRRGHRDLAVIDHKFGVRHATVGKTSRTGEAQQGNQGMDFHGSSIIRPG